MPRNLALVLDLASQVANARIGQIRDIMDESSAGDDAGPFGGRSIPLATYRELLKRDRLTQERAAATWPYLTESERASLRSEVERAIPTPEEP